MESGLLEGDLPEKLKMPIKRLLERENVINFKVNCRIVPLHGKGFTATQYEIEINGKTKDKDKELHLFVKHIIDGSSVKFFSMSKLHSAELFAYRELFKIYDQLQEQANITLEERFQTVKIYEESNEEMIIMENLAKKGFSSCHSMTEPSLDFIKMSIIQLAKFHGLSFVLRETKPTYFAEKIKTLDHFNLFNEDWTKLSTILFQVATQHVDEQYKYALDKVYDMLKNKFCKFFSDKTIKSSLCHGDYKHDNIMCAKNENENEKMIVIDYQTIYYGCPVLDLINFIFISTNREFRKMHLIDLKNTYYEALSKFMKYFNLDTEVVYPREGFEKMFEEKLDYGLIIGVLHLPFTYATKNVSDLQELDWKIECDATIKDRYHDILEDFIKRGYI